MVRSIMIFCVPLLSTLHQSCTFYLHTLDTFVKFLSFCCLYFQILPVIYFEYYLFRTHQTISFLSFLSHVLQLQMCVMPSVTFSYVRWCTKYNWNFYYLLCLEYFIWHPPLMMKMCWNILEACPWITFVTLYLIWTIWSQQLTLFPIPRMSTATY